VEHERALTCSVPAARREGRLIIEKHPLVTEPTFISQGQRGGKRGEGEECRAGRFPLSKKVCRGKVKEEINGVSKEKKNHNGEGERERS